MPAESDRAVQSLVVRQAVQNGVEIGRVVVDTGPGAAWNGASQRGNGACTQRAVVRNFFLAQALLIVIGVAGSEDVFSRTDQRNAAEIGTQVNLARQVKPDGVQALATAEIVGAAQREHGVPCRCNGQRDAERLHQRHAPDIGRYYHDGSLNIALRCLYACYALAARHNAVDGNVFADTRAMFARLLGEAVGGCHRVCYARVRFVTGQCHTLAAIPRRSLGDLVRADNVRIHALFLLHLHVGAQGISAVFTCHYDHAGCDEAAVAAYAIRKLLKDGQALFRHAHRKIVGVVLPDDGSRPSRRAIAQPLSFKQNELATALPGKMIGDARAHHPTTNDENISLFRHSVYSWSTLNLSCRLSLSVLLSPVILSAAKNLRQQRADSSLRSE